MQTEPGNEMSNILQRIAHGAVNVAAATCDILIGLLEEAGEHRAAEIVERYRDSVAEGE